jgi:hypothetical protein
MIEDRTTPDMVALMRNLRNPGILRKQVEGGSPSPGQAVGPGQVLQLSPLQSSQGSQADLFTLWFQPNTKAAITDAVWARTAFTEGQRPESRWNAALVAVKDEIRSLSHQLNELRQEISGLQNSRTYVVPLTTLSPAFQMTEKIPVTIEGDGESFTATFVEANISASGETEGDAIANFKESLMSTYEILEHLPASQLGELPTRQWSILQRIVRRSE